MFGDYTHINYFARQRRLFWEYKRKFAYEFHELSFVLYKIQSNAKTGDQ